MQSRLACVVLEKIHYISHCRQGTFSTERETNPMELHFWDPEETKTGLKCDPIYANTCFLKINQSIISLYIVQHILVRQNAKKLNISRTQ